MNKNGNIILNMILLIIILFAFSFVAFFAYSIFDNLDDDILADVQLNESKETILEVQERYPTSFDGLIVFMFFLLWGAVLIAAFFMDDHPIFFFFTLVLMIFVVIAGMFIGNFYEEIFQDATMAGIATSFPMTNWMLSHFLMVSIVVGVSIMLVLFAKQR